MQIALYVTIICLGLIGLMWGVLESGHDRDENAPTYGGLPR